MCTLLETTGLYNKSRFVSIFDVALMTRWITCFPQNCDILESARPSMLTVRVSNVTDVPGQGVFFFFFFSPILWAEIPALPYPHSRMLSARYKSISCFSFDLLFSRLSLSISALIQTGLKGVRVCGGGVQFPVGVGNMGVLGCRVAKEGNYSSRVCLL